jgi:hypothetical protein
MVAVAVLTVVTALTGGGTALVKPPVIAAPPAGTAAATPFSYPLPRAPVTPIPPPPEEEVVAAETTATSQPAEEPPPPPPEPEPKPEPESEPEPEQEPPPPPPAARCPTELKGTLPHVAAAGHHIAGRFGVPTSDIGGRAERSGRSYHPVGRALDFMVGREKGDAISDYVLGRMDELGVIQVIWRQRINHGSGWEPMSDRGSDTANHFDHVHLSFAASLPDALLRDLTC